MCGIAGSIRWDGVDETHVVRQMTEALRHRGPDAGDVIRRGAAFLGHRRLAVIDLDQTANQPMTDGDGKHWIVFNGEIYNFRDLRAELEAGGERFRTKSDTEVLLRSFVRWGENSLNRLNGMFAFALWDERHQRLTLARDRLGEKPLYYRHDDNGLIFASELTALRLHPSVTSALDPTALGHYLSLNYTLSDACLIKDVAKLPAGHVLVLERGKPIKIRSYWDLARSFREKRRFRSKDEATDEVRALIDDAVRIRTVSDVPLGAFLSGGIDSATIVASMRSMEPSSRIATFTAGFDIAAFDELAEARATADRLNVQHRARKIDVNLATTLEKVVAATDEPFADTSMIPLYHLAKFARESVTVCLSGDGGDEVFAGYMTYVADRIHHLTRWLPGWSTRGLFRILDPILPVTFGKVSFDYKVRQFLLGHDRGSDQAHCFWRSIFPEHEKARLLLPDWQAVGNDPWSCHKKHFDAVAGCHYLDRAMYVDIKTWLVDDILTKLDRTTMAHALEARVPLLDHRLVELAASLPVSMKLAGFTTKRVLKEAQRDRLPQQVIRRRKAGFNAPVSEWLNGDLGDLAEQATTSRQMSTYFNPDVIRTMWREHRIRRRDHGLKLFGLACLGLWLAQPSARNQMPRAT